MGSSWPSFFCLGVLERQRAKGEKYGVEQCVWMRVRVCICMCVYPHHLLCWLVLCGHLGLPHGVGDSSFFLVPLLAIGATFSWNSFLLPSNLLWSFSFSLSCPTVSLLYLAHRPSTISHQRCLGFISIHAGPARNLQTHRLMLLLEVRVNNGGISGIRVAES